MDRCRKCKAKYDDETVVSIDFSIGGSTSHNWLLCSNCAEKLEEVVLNWMQRREVELICQKMSFVDEHGKVV